MDQERERDVEVRGLRLHLRERGPEGAPACVLLHGWLDTSASFDRLAPLLAGRGLHTCALDLRGHGDSGWVGAGGFYHLVEYVADLDGALDALGLALPDGQGGRSPSPVRLIGHSLGAIVALLYAAARPDRVAHVALLDGIPLAIRPSEVPLRLAEYLDDLKAPRARRPLDSLEHAVARVRKASPALRDDAALHLARTGAAPDPAQGGKLAWKWDPWLRVHSPLPMVEEVFQELLPHVLGPVLLLRAGNTFLPEEAELRERLSRLRGRLEIATIAGTSHHLHLEEPEAVVERIVAAYGS